MILKFTSQSCQPCKQLSAALERLAIKDLIEVDIDTQAEMTAAYKIRGVPTLVCTVTGNRLVGMKNDKDILEFVESCDEV